jgi:hypothetical protein
MLRALPFALLLAVSPALAQTVHCADADGEVTVEYNVDRVAGSGVITRVQMQIADDFGISTDPAHHDYDGEDIAEQTVTSTFLEVKLRVAGGLPTLILRLVDGDEGAQWVRAGVLSVAGGGVWVVSCDTPV